MNWEYIAGFFDGEGNIHVNQIRGKNSVSHQILCRIYSSNRQILEDIKEFLGYGTICERARNSQHNSVFELIMKNKEENLNFLKSVFPSLILKKAQAIFVLDNYDFRIGSNNANFDLEKCRSYITRTNVSHSNFNLPNNSQSLPNNSQNLTPVNEVIKT